MGEFTDPWDWTVEQVVHRFCKSRDLWEEGMPRAKLPASEQLEQNLIANDIDGPALLLDMDKETLKSEFNIKSIGQRSAFMWAVNKLRSISLKYQSQHSVLASQPHFIGAVEPDTPRPSSHHLGFLDSPAVALNQPVRQPPLFQPKPVNQQAVFGAAAETAEDGLNARVRPGESLIEDEGGRKRRKLVLNTQPSSQLQAAQNEDIPKVNDGLEVEVNKKAKASTGVSFACPMANTFFGDTKIPIDEVFYGKTRLGQAIVLEGQGLPQNPSNAEGISFNSVSQISCGDRQYVYKQMHHFLANSERLGVERNGKQMIAILPYRDGLVSKTHRRSATLFQTIHGSDELRATREDALALNTEVAYNDQDESAGHEWDFLAKWDKGYDSPPLPLWLDSDSEGDYSSEFLAEIEAEATEKEHAPTKRGEPLRKEAVGHIIDEAIEAYAEAWKDRKLPRLGSTAYATWKRAQKGRRLREVLIEGARRNIDRLEARLSKLRDNILDEVRTKETQVTKQCSIMEPTVFEREDQAWKVSVWKQKDAPSRTPPVPRKKREASVHASDEDGEALDSDSDVLSDGMTSFLEVDETDMTRMSDAEVVSQPGSEKPEFPRDGVTRAGNSITSFMDVNAEGSEPHLDTSNQMEIDGERNGPSDEESDLLGVQLPSTLRPELSGNNDIIDLTISSDLVEESEVEVLRTEISTSQRFYKDPEKATDAEISGWDWDELEERNDRKRIVIKILHDLKEKEYDTMRNRISKVSKGDFVDETKRAVGVIKRKDDRMAGSEAHDFRVIKRFAKLYICWTHNAHQYWNGPIPEGIALATCQSKDTDSFYSFVRLVMTQQQRKESSQRRSVQEISDDSEPVLRDTPHNKRKREVKISAAGVDLRESAQQRRDRYREREQTLLKTVPEAVDSSALIINLGINQEDGYDYIYIDQHIASRMKPHQLDGVRFMWRELVTTGGSEGCLLAHTMGLGKTMQAITVLVTLAQAAKSNNPRILNQIPEKLRKSQTLVICPASLIQNWLDELSIWAPPPKERIIGPVTFIDANLKPAERLSEIQWWHSKGGILIIGYHLFQALIHNKGTEARIGALSSTAIKAARAPPLNENEHKRVLKALLREPNIIIADEAHVLKNSESLVARAAAQFQSTSRIALTGSPLSNNLQEVYSTINWVAPGYLGEVQEFKAYYQEPIEQGTWKDSTAYERRKSLMRLKTLNHDIDPKIHRAGITVLKGNLKPKVEFVIRVPLTPIQEEAYRVYVRSMLSGADVQVSNARLWSWLAILTLLCNHPKSFLTKLEEQGTTQSAKGHTSFGIQGAAKRIRGARGINDGSSPDDEADDMPGDEHVSNLDISTALVDDEKNVFSKVKDISSPEHSYKVTLFIQILELSKRAGDKVLVFSHSIPTLGYLEGLFTHLEMKFVRIDGTVNITKRQQNLQGFNEGRYDVFLISTRAGGLGLNIPGANRVVIFDFGFNPTWEEQAIGRAYRIGQSKPVFVYRFVAGGTFEANIYNKALFKVELASRVVDKKNPTRNAERKVRDFLYEPLAIEQEDITQFQGKDPLVLDEILAQQTAEGQVPYIRAITTMNTLQIEANEPLTEEEKSIVAKDIEEQKLRRTDPAKWRAKYATNQAILTAESVKSQPLIPAAEGTKRAEVRAAATVSRQQERMRKEATGVERFSQVQARMKEFNNSATEFSQGRGIAPVAVMQARTNGIVIEARPKVPTVSVGHEPVETSPSFDNAEEARRQDELLQEAAQKQALAEIQARLQRSEQEENVTAPEQAENDQPMIDVNPEEQSLRTRHAETTSAVEQMTERQDGSELDGKDHG
ncbi:hypothetical protein B0A49_05123 [Cryomyces minteri]|uniref:Helicase ATP-binding domain-containing protein n=1 Tax=Cryomyces minteri TaxID=331657 RepID=A0A4U0XMH9_9PEZI|nr:hypothetical protein B0A49_05123 [Cryomyces minteri]